MSQQPKKIMRSRSRSQSRSPMRNVKQKPVKTESQLIKQEKKNNFNKEIDALIKHKHHLDKLTEKYARVKPSHNLVFSKIDESRVLTRQELSSAKTEYDRRMTGLKKFYVEGTKHSRISILPNSFKAAYIPIKVGQVFVDFLATDGRSVPNFGRVPNEEGTAWITSSNLLDLLPRAKEGFFLKNSLTLLMYIYAAENNLKSKVASEGQKNIPDDRMNKVFGKIPSLYYHEAGQDKVLMSKSGKKLTTYDVVSGKNTEFNPSKIQNYYFQSLQSLNIYEAADLTKSDLSTLNDSTVRNDLLKEFFIIEKANKLLKLSKK